MNDTANTAAAPRSGAGMTVDELRARLRRAQGQLGAGGHFSVTFYHRDGGGCSIMYWTRRDGAEAVERCDEVGHGTLAECLAALDRYVEARRPAAATGTTDAASGAPPPGR